MTNDRPKPAAESKRPYHIGVAIGLTTGVYAVSLLGATTMQIEADRALIADRAPVEDAISALEHHHDQQEVRLLEARLGYEAGSAGYGVVAQRLAELEARLAKVGRTVSRVEALAGSLSVLGALPAVPSRGGGASSGGGGVSSSGGGSSGGGTVKLPPAPAPKPTPPPTQGSTGASG